MDSHMGRMLRDKLKGSRAAWLLLGLGLLLLLLPGSGGSGKNEADPFTGTGVSLEQEGEKLGALLSESEAVGRAQVLLSHSGAVILCDGAGDPRVRLSVTNAVAAYTGLGRDKIQVIQWKRK